jgi:hypothetical protein
MGNCIKCKFLSLRMEERFTDLLHLNSQQSFEVSRADLNIPICVMWTVRLREERFAYGHVLRENHIQDLTFSSHSSVNHHLFFTYLWDFLPKHNMN